jgi:type I restriction enzyme, S subunit
VNASLRRPWPVVHLGQIAKFVRGVSYKPADVSTAENPSAIACMRTKNIQVDLEDDDLVFIPRRPIKESKLLREGDILVSSANSWNLVGKCCWVPNLSYPATFGGFTSVLRADPTRSCPRYLYHWFSSDRTQKLARSFGQQTTNISNLNQSRCLELEISLPSLEEQRRIAEILDKASELRRKRRRAIDLLDSLTPSLFLDMFGDPIANAKKLPVGSLENVVSPSRKITYGILKPGPDHEGGIPYVRVVDIQNSLIDVAGLKRTTSVIASEYRRSTLRNGDLLISIRGHVGRMAITPPECDGANITQDTARLAITAANTEFIKAQLETDSAKHWMGQRTKGAAVKGINLGDLRQFPLILPPRPMQDEFANKIRIVRTMLEKGSRQYSNLNVIFSSLQSQAFSGQL